MNLLYTWQLHDRDTNPRHFDVQTIVSSLSSCWPFYWRAKVSLTFSTQIGFRCFEALWLVFTLHVYIAQSLSWASVGLHDVSTECDGLISTVQSGNILELSHFVLSYAWFLGHIECTGCWLFVWLRSNFCYLWSERLFLLICQMAPIQCGHYY